MAGEAFPILNVADLAPVRAFYTRVFDAEETYRFPDDGEPTFLVLRVGSGTIALGLGTTPALYGETPLPASGHAVDLCVYVPDLGRTLSAAGEAVAVPARDMSWGERVAYVRDPAGTMLLVIQDPADR